jgi:hypothetical protein
MKVDPRSFKGLSRFLAPSAGGPVADRAVNEKLISADQLQECIAEQDRSGRPLDEILVERGFLKADDVTRLRAPAMPAEVHNWVSNPERQLGHYILVSLLGTGGMAEVWKAWDRSLGRWVAVKYLKREVGHPSQRIEREGRMAGQLSHPSIISIFERGQHEGRPYLVMPFVDGLPPKSPLPPREAARLALEVARALAHAHEAGIIHRDVKPANILVESQGRVVLADFGLAILDDAVTSKWAMSGTPEYASPEQIRGDPLDPRTDIYSLGATLYHLLSGRPPFMGAGPDEITEKVLHEEPPPLRDAPKALAASVKRAMSRNREDRHASITQLATELEAFIDRARHGMRLRPGWIVVAILSAVLPWALTLLLLSQFQEQGERRLVLQSLREGDRLIAMAERRRADPTSNAVLVAGLAREALDHYNQALQRAGGPEPDASMGIGRCRELTGDDVLAERAYVEAGSIPEAVSALARIWARRLLEGRRVPETKATIQLKLRSGHPLRSLADGNWEAVLAVGSDRDDDGVRLVQGAAAIELKRWDAALRHLEEGLRLRPRDSTLLFYKGVACAGKGDRQGAITSWVEAIRHQPKDWPLYAELLKRRAALGP